MLDVIAFDADDTLWHNEILYSRAEQRLAELLAPHTGRDGVAQDLYETERVNVKTYGYGIKGFTLSMIETAIRLTDGQFSGRDVEKILDLAKEMLRAPVQLLDYVAEIVPALATSYPLMLITKGDLFDQESKIARSGLAPHFSHIEIVSEKTMEVYRGLLEKHGVEPQRFLMVGNSLRSDVLPVAALGSHAVHVPYQITWQHEQVAVEGDWGTEPYTRLDHLGLLLDFVEQLEQKGVASCRP